MRDVRNAATAAQLVFRSPKRRAGRAYD